MWEIRSISVTPPSLSRTKRGYTSPKKIGRYLRILTLPSLTEKPLLSLRSCANTSADLLVVETSVCFRGSYSVTIAVKSSITARRKILRTSKIGLPAPRQDSTRITAPRISSERYTLNKPSCKVCNVSFGTCNALRGSLPSRCKAVLSSKAVRSYPRKDGSLKRPKSE